MPKPPAPPAPAGDDPPPVPEVSKPPKPRPANKCPSCDGATDGGRFCRDCGARVLPEELGATDSGLEARLATLEARVDPLVKLGDALKAAGINLGDVKPAQVEQLKGLAGLFGGGGGPGGLLGAIGANIRGMLGGPAAPPAVPPKGGAK